MSREIKFRIWDNQKNEWLGASDNDVLAYYGFHLVGEVMTVQAPPQWALDPHCVVEQYTGLKDKSGKEIYEGDIVKFEGSSFVIGWNIKYAGFGFEPIGNDSMRFLTSGLSMHKCEVIGNIHENGDLLND